MTVHLDNVQWASRELEWTPHVYRVSADLHVDLTQRDSDAVTAEILNLTAGMLKNPTVECHDDVLAICGPGSCAGCRPYCSATLSRRLFATASVRSSMRSRGSCLRAWHGCSNCGRLPRTLPNSTNQQLGQASAGSANHVRNVGFHISRAWCSGCRGRRRRQQHCGAVHADSSVPGCGRDPVQIAAGVHPAAVAVPASVGEHPALNHGCNVADAMPATTRTSALVSHSRQTRSVPIESIRSDRRPTESCPAACQASSNSSS